MKHESMIFNETYSAYYIIVAKILRYALENGGIRPSEVAQIAEKNGFSNSRMNITSLLIPKGDGQAAEWPFLVPSGKERSDDTLLMPIIDKMPDMPLTTLEKRWLRTLMDDPRIRLFPELPDDLDIKDVEPLFSLDDFRLVDQFGDGDPYEDETYIRNFRTLLAAIRDGSELKIDFVSGRGEDLSVIMRPEKLIYSMQDDKFRVTGYEADNMFASTINLGRIRKVFPNDTDYVRASEDVAPRGTRETEELVVEIRDERNALERFLILFSRYQKGRTEKIEENSYRQSIFFPAENEREVVNLLLNMGPFVKVLAPEAVIDLIREKLTAQKLLGVI